MRVSPAELRIESLGDCEHNSPLSATSSVQFVEDERRVLIQHEVLPGDEIHRDLSLEKAGPRRRIFFDPNTTTAAIVTCGGLSPGLNNVIRSIYLELRHTYGVRRVLGIQHGYQGLNPAIGEPPIEIHGEFVENIHHLGGTTLGTSRGPQDPTLVVDFLAQSEIDILFCVGGDGTQRGAGIIAQEIERRGLLKSVVGVPKTIDNDIPFVSLSFGHITALEEAEKVLRAAHTEARGAVGGVALVKLMGRDAGFIAAGAALASQDANFVLVPEVPFPLEGEDGFLYALEKRLQDRGHALIVAAEGAGQHLFPQPRDRQDASGNTLLHDIGGLLRERIMIYFRERNIPMTLKYIDPSYIIRSVPANAWDQILSNHMARRAVHAAMAGKTNMMIGYWDSEFVHVPICSAVAQKKKMDLSDDLWQGVLRSTGQPHW